MSPAAAQQDAGRGPRSGCGCWGSGREGASFQGSPVGAGHRPCARPVHGLRPSHALAFDSCPRPPHGTCRRHGAPRPRVTVRSTASASLRSPAQDTLQTPEQARRGPRGDGSGPGLGWLCTWSSLALDTPAPPPHPGRLGLFTLGVTRWEVARSLGGAPRVACGRGRSGASAVRFQGPSGDWGLGLPSAGFGEVALRGVTCSAGALQALLPQQLPVPVELPPPLLLLSPLPSGAALPGSPACPSPAARREWQLLRCPLQGPGAVGGPSPGVKFLQLPSGRSGHRVTLGGLRPPRHPP